MAKKAASKMALTPEQKQLGDFRVRQLKAIDEFGAYDVATFGRMDEQIYQKVKDGIERKMAEGSKPELMREVSGAVSEVIFGERDNSPTKIVNNFESHAGRFNGEVKEVVQAPKVEEVEKRPISEPYSDDVMKMAGFINRLKYEAAEAAKVGRETSLALAGENFETDKATRVAKGIYGMLSRIEEQHTLMIKWAENELEKMKLKEKI